MAGQDRLGYYVAQYDGEIAAVDEEVGRVLAALKESVAMARRTVVILTSDHGESLGEHDYYFDHGEDLFDPCLAHPPDHRAAGRGAGRRSEAAGFDTGPLSHDPRRGEGLLSSGPGGSQSCCPR